MSANLMTRQTALPDFEFSLQAAKSKVFKSTVEGTPAATPAFSRFYDSALYDRLVRALLLMFTARFQREVLLRSVERARQQHLEGRWPHTYY